MHLDISACRTWEQFSIGARNRLPTSDEPLIKVTWDCFKCEVFYVFYSQLPKSILSRLNPFFWFSLYELGKLTWPICSLVMVYIYIINLYTIFTTTFKRFWLYWPIFITILVQCYDEVCANIFKIKELLKFERTIKLSEHKYKVT